MKTFNETQMGHPWGWCFDVLQKHEIDSKLLSEVTGTPRSTARALYNGTNQNPRYEFLVKIIRYCIDLENGTAAIFDEDAVEEAKQEGRDKLTDRIADPPVIENTSFAIGDFL